VRYLSSLGGASTSRVLNLATCAAAGGLNGNRKSRGLFQSPVVSRAILVKHRVRPHQEFLFGYRVEVATKIIVAADPADLSRGGESFFVDQRGFKGKLQEIGRYPNGGLDADSEILHRLAELPSLDPFLARGHLQMCGIDVPGGCLELSGQNLLQLEEYAAGELIGFVRMVVGDGETPLDSVAARLVRALFGDEVGVDLEPFRAVLGLERHVFARAIFAWRGFLYWKWQMQQAREHIPRVLAELQHVHAISRNGSYPIAEIGPAKTAVAEWVFLALKRIRQLLQRYDAAYLDLVENGRPTAFRGFLEEAPRRFFELGEKAAAISHILTFWRCRFPNGVVPIEAEELCAMLQDFESGFALPSDHAYAAASG
jgi:hypothetical protein